MFVCTNNDLEAGMKEKPKNEPNMDVREHLLNLWTITQFTKHYGSGFKKVRNLEFLLRYGLEVWSRKRKKPMDVQKMIKNWKEVVIILCTAHDKVEVDKAEYKMDELLTPILTAPVKELRVFYTGLSKALKADKKVPFFIWKMFDTWGEVVIKNAPDAKKIQRLRKKLAYEIADLAEPHIIPDISKAVAGALMWRDDETLKEIKSDLEAGVKPKLKGKESCLFMVTKKPDGEEHMVML